MESQDEKKEHEHNIWEIYRKEWATASPEKRIELDKRMHRWQKLMKDGWSAQQAYYKAMEEELDFKVAEEPLGKQLAIPSPPRMRKTPVIFLSLALVAAIVYSVIIIGDRNTLNAELESVQSVLTSAQSELTSTRLDLTTTQERLTSTRLDLTTTQETLTSTEVDLSYVKQTLTSTQGKLDSMQSDLSSTKQSLAMKQGELDNALANIVLYVETFGAYVYAGKQPDEVIAVGRSVPTVNLINNPAAKNPTWQQLVEFLLSDPTDDETYQKYSFNCVDFSDMLHNNAEAAGIKSAFVAIEFYDEDVGHTLNAFRTTDKGLVYVDNTGGDWLASFKHSLYGYTSEYDRIAYVAKGKEYGVVSIDKATSPKYSYYEQIGKSLSDWLPMGIVESITIYW